MTNAALRSSSGTIYATGPMSPATALADAFGLSHPPWHDDAACKETPEVNFFPTQGEDCTAAKAVCERCLCIEECRAYAMADASLVGIWGGTSTDQRAKMRKGDGRRRRQAW